MCTCNLMWHVLLLLPWQITLTAYIMKNATCCKGWSVVFVHVYTLSLSLSLSLSPSPHLQQKVVELHKAEQPWVPAKEQMKEMSEEEKITAELYRKFQSILNKLTPQKFQALAEQALLLKIDTEERLKGVIDKIFTKVCERGH